MLTLRYRDEAGGIRTRELAATPAGALVIGRSPACDLAINHPSVSRQHARVSVREDGAYLADLGSTHGTFVRGQRISGEVRLAAGDTFTIGQVDVAVDGPRPGVAVALTEDRQVISGAETLYRRVEDPAGEGAARGSPGDAERLRRLLSEIGRTLVTVQSLGEVLERVIDLVFESVRAERAILMLRDAAADALTPRVVRYHDGRTPGPATISRTVVNMVMRDRVAMLAADALNDARLEDAGSIHELNIRSFMCAPLWNRSDIIGVLYVDTPRTKRFSEDDLAVFTALANYAAVAIEQARLAGRLLEETRRRERLQRYHSPGVVNRILTGGAGGGALQTQVRDVSVMFADIVGFTTMAESMEPAAVAEMLNGFFAAMTEVIFEHAGTLDKFIGDAILAVFGAPFEQADHAVNAVQAAIGMRRVLVDLNAHRGGPPIALRIAIHSGRAVTGDVGSPRRREFTVLGDVVNTASRLQSAVAEPGQIIISRQTLERAGGSIRATPVGPVTLRGRQAAIEVFRVEA